MSQPRLLPFLLLLLLCFYANVSARSLRSTTWMGRDQLGRMVPTREDVGNARSIKTVGIFYFLWAEGGIPGPFDNTKLLKDAGGDRSKVKYGPPMSFHHWGEPLFGYYRIDDEWVLRKHASMLSDAGVDFVFLDMTNALTYDKSWRALFTTWSAMRDEGNPTPNIAIILHAAVKNTLAHLFETLYQPGFHKELWQMWDGKPLILGNSSEADPNMASFFTWRQSWAWTNSDGWFKDGHDAWPWIDNFPQGYGWHANKTIKENMPTAVGGWPTLNIGRSFDGPSRKQPDAKDARPDVGHYFAQQISWTLKATCEDASFICKGVIDDSELPSSVLITSWNEWMAMRFVVQPGQDQDFLGNRLKEGETFFCRPISTRI